MDFSITKMIYTVDQGSPKKVDLPRTEICIDKEGVLTDTASVSLTIRKGDAGFPTYIDAPIPGSISDQCAEFAVEKPAEGDVVYTLRVRDGNGGTSYTSAKVKFFFQGWCRFQILY